MDYDPENCGACGRTCRSTEYCSGGACIPQSSAWLATDISPPEDLVFDQTNVYWTSPSGNTISSVDKNGGSVITVAPSLSRPRRLVLDDAYAYWSDDLGGAIMRALKDGTGSSEIVTPATSPLSITVDSANVYWGAGNEIMSAPKSGGGPIAVFATLPAPAGGIFEVLSDDIALFVRAWNSPPVWCAWRIELRDALVSRLFCDNGLAMGVDSTRLCLSGGDHIKHIICVDKHDGRIVAYLEIGETGVPITSIAPTSCDVMWTDGGRLNLTLQRTASPYFPMTLFTSRINRIVVDGDTAFWTDASAIGKLPIP